MIDREEAEIGHIKFYCIEKEIDLIDNKIKQIDPRTIEYIEFEGKRYNKK